MRGIARIIITLLHATPCIRESRPLTETEKLFVPSPVVCPLPLPSLHLYLSLSLYDDCLSHTTLFSRLLLSCCQMRRLLRALRWRAPQVALFENSLSTHVNRSQGLQSSTSKTCSNDVNTHESKLTIEIVFVNTNIIY